MSLFGASLLLLLAQAEPGSPTVDVRPSTVNVAVGERFQVTVETKGPSGVVYEFPGEVSSGTVELVQANRSSALANRVTYDAQIFAIGEEGRIPEIEIRYRSKDGSQGSIKSAPIAMNVVSTLDPNEQNPAPADFAPPVPVMVARAFWVASGVAGLLLIALMVLLVRRLRFPKKLKGPQITPAITPEEEAMAGLDRLTAARGGMEPRAFYIQLIQLLKQYLERRLEAPVLEMTSTETLAFVKTHAWTSPHAVALRDLVTSADLVKFGGSSDATNSERQIQLVRELVGRIDRLRRAELDRQAAHAEGRRKTA